MKIMARTRSKKSVAEERRRGASPPKSAEEDSKGLLEGVRDFLASAIEEGTETFGRVLKLLEEGSQSPLAPRQILEGVFEQVRLGCEEAEELIAQKVAEVVERLGLPTSQQIQDLADRVERLAGRVETFSNSRKKKTSAGRDD